MGKEQKNVAPQQSPDPLEGFGPPLKAAGPELPKTSPSVAAEKEPEPLTAEEVAFIGTLENLWVPHATKDLEVRLEMGRLLNAQFGDPPTIQKRGEHVLEKAAARLHIATSDMSRLRWFAHHVKGGSIAQKFPGVRSWSEVKDKIAELNNPDRSTAKKGEKSLKRLRKELFDALTLLEDHIQKIKDHITVNELAEIGKKVDVLVAIVDRITEPVQKPQRQERSLAS